MHSHRSRYREQPIRLHSDNCTLAGYWEINSVKAHCLLDSGSEGVLLLVMGDGVVVMDDSGTRCASKCAWEREKAGWSNSVGQNKKLVRTTVNSCKWAHHEWSG